MLQRIKIHGVGSDVGVRMESHNGQKCSRFLHLSRDFPIEVEIIYLLSRILFSGRDFLSQVDIFF